MPELSPLALVGWSGVAVLVVCWLWVSFSKPGPRQERIAWIGTVAMYVAFGCLFTSLFLRAQGATSWPGMIGFGFLMVFFGAGLVVATARLLRVLVGRAGGSATDSATN